MGSFRRALASWLAALLSAGLLVAAAASRWLVFEDITATSGIRFSTENGASAEKKMIETMGSGFVVLDYDRDSRTDIIFVNSGLLQVSAETSPHLLAL